MTEPQVLELTDADGDQVAAVLAEAFVEYPTTRWFLGERRIDRHAALAPLLEHVGSLHLNVLGVRAAWRGHGFARRLLDHVHGLAAAVPNGRGVSLTTEDPANVALYRHFGYEPMGSVEVAPGITSWVMRRRPDEVR